MSLSQADILVSNNPAAYGVVYSDQIAGHRSVKSLTDLYALADCILSKTGDNTDDDAIGQEWYVSDEGYKYRLTDWTNRNSASGWEIIKDGSEVSYEASISSGTLIGNLVVDGISTPIYAPTAGESVTYDEATQTTSGLMSASDKKKLDNIEEGADVTTVTQILNNGTHIATVNNIEVYAPTYDTSSYELPVATSDTLGGVKVGDGLEVESDGTLNCTINAIEDSSLASYSDIESLFDDADLTELLAYGVEWDESSSSATLTRIGNLDYHKSLPVQSEMKGCVFDDSGVKYYLNSDNWAYKEDGTDSVLDGTDGDVGVEIPAFYIWQEQEGTVKRVYISKYKFNDNAEYSPKCIISAYRCVADRTDTSNIKLVSVVNTSLRGGNNNSDYDTYLDNDVFRTQLGKPTTSTTRANARTYARNNNVELLNYTQYKNILYWLYVIEYANFNVQSTYNSSLTSDGYHQGGLGNGVTTLNWTYWNYYNSNYPIIPCGYTNSLGNNTGIISAEITVPTTEDESTTTTYTVNVPRWRGIEQPFGDIYTSLDGILINRTDNTTDSTCTAYIINDPDNYIDTTTNIQYNRSVEMSIPSNGYITTFVDSGYADIIPSNVGGSSTTYKCDYAYVHQDSGTTSYPNSYWVGGNSNLGSHAGLAYSSFRVAASSSNAYVGFRTIKVLE